MTSKTISGTSSLGISLSATDTTITSTGLVKATGKNVVVGKAPTAWTLVNQGRILATSHDAVALYAGGYIANAGTITNSGGYGVLIKGSAGTVVNTGTIDAGQYLAVYLYAGGSVTNSNAGVIYGQDGVKVYGSAGTIVNAGTIGGGSFGIDLTPGGSATNAGSGVVTGGRFGIFASGIASIANLGTVDGGFAGGVYLNQGNGDVTNASSGTITGGASGVELFLSTGNVVNAGSIGATAATGAGVEFFGTGGYISNAAFGVITGYDGVLVSNIAGTVINAGSIIGSSGTAVALEGDGGNRVIVDPTAMFGGNVVAQGTGNVLELGSGASTGTISGNGTVFTGLGAGTSFTGFGTLEIDPGAHWVISGAIPGGETIAIGTGSDLVLDGSVLASSPVDFTAVGGTLGLGDAADFGATVFDFRAGDAIDFTSITGSGGIIAGVDATNHLTLTSNGTLLADIQLDPSQNFDGTRFSANPDGSGGTVVTSVSSQTISGTSSLGITLSFLDTTITSTGLVKATGKNVVVGKSPTAWTLVNDGRIVATSHDAVALYAGGYVGNAGTITNSGGYGVLINGSAGTVVNTGTINAGQYIAAYLIDGGSVTNASSGVIYGSEGVKLYNAAGTVLNAGSIEGQLFGAQLYSGGSVTNFSSGVITGGNVGVLASGGAVTVDNLGTIEGGIQAGIELAQTGGIITNGASGTITGGAYGVQVFYSPGSVLNAGAISGTEAGVYFRSSAGYLSNAASGVITGKYGVLAKQDAGTVINAGTIIGTSGTAVAFDGTAGNRLIVDPTALFSGKVVAQGTDNTLELGSGASTGTISGIGTSFTGFGTIETDPNASWVISDAIPGGETIDIGAGSDLVLDGTVPASSPVIFTSALGTSAVDITTGSGTLGLGDPTDFGATVLGFQAGEAIDFTSIGSAGSITAGVDAANHLTLTSNGASLAEIQLDPTRNFKGTQFSAASDGSGGTVVTAVSSQTITGFPTNGVTLSLIDTTNLGEIENPGSNVIVGGSLTAWTLVNKGNIFATAGDGVAFYAGGYVYNLANDQITNGGGNGVSITGGAGTVINAGSITAGGPAGDGVVLSSPGGDVSNAAGGVISGRYGVSFSSGGGRVTNAGSIIGTGGTAVAFGGGGGDRLIVGPTALFGGSVVAQGTGNVLELVSAATTGTISGLGSSFTGFGVIEIDPGATWVVSGTVTGNGTIDIGAGSDVVINGSDASSPVDFTAGSGTLGLGDPAHFGATVFGMQAGDAIDFTSITSSGSIVAGVDAGNHLRLTSNGTLLTEIQLDPSENFSGTTFAVTPGDGGVVVTDTPLCFCAGTMLATPAGEMPVERLAVGDLVLTQRGRVVPIVWIGVGQVMATRGRRNAATPVIVRKGALADNVPHRDLHVTKGHSLYLDDVLVPVEFLVNHRSILWDDRAQEVSIYHVEIESHDVLLANGAPAESYRDDGNRWLFRNANTGWEQAPKLPCAPVIDGGPIVDAIWLRLLERTGPRRGFPLSDDPDLHLLVDGRRVDAREQADNVYCFDLSGTPASIRVVSRAAAPQELGVRRDPRCLGVALRRIVARRGTKFRVIKADDPRLTQGFHMFESSNGLRWTDGDAVLEAALFDGFGALTELVLHVAGTTRYVEDGASSRVA